MKIMLENSLGVLKEVKIGFSWTNLFFGFFVPLFRGDLLWAFFQFITAWVTAGITVLIFPFFYNRIYINGLLNKGFKATSEDGEKVLKEKGFIKK